MGRLSTTALATGVSATDIANLATDIANLKTSIRTGGGFALSLAPTARTGDGTAAHSALTMPDSGNLTPTSGNKYQLNGVFTARGAVGGLLLGVRRVQNIVVQYDSKNNGSWAMVATGQNVVSDKHATFATFFAAEADFPDIEDNAGALSALHTVANAQDVTIEFDGTIADLGANS